MKRRSFLTALGALGAAATIPGVSRLARSAPPLDKPDRFLITMSCFGGASIVDSFLPVAASESNNPDVINAYPDNQIVDIAGSPFRAVDRSGVVLGTSYDTDLVGFANKYKNDMLVMTHTGTSVNHAVGQKRAMTGNNAFHARTLPEMVALEYGAACPIPNVNMGSLGYVEPGDDGSLPPYCYHEAVADPAMWAFGLDGSKGLPNVPSSSRLAAARTLRNDQLDPASSFYKTFQLSDRLKRWKLQRNEMVPAIESEGLLQKLTLLTSEDADLASVGLAESPDVALLEATFPNLANDPLEAQGALAYLLIKNRVSVAVTLGTNFNVSLGDGESLILNPPLSFDNSHTDHRNTQAFMWNRMLSVADRLIALLSAVELDASTGESFYDRSLFYFATEFGRSKNRQTGSDSFGTMHDLNNGALLVSPLLKGNQVLGGVDPDTAMTYGFDESTGAPNPNVNMSEGHIFATVAQAMDLDTSGGNLPDMSVALS